MFRRVGKIGTEVHLKYKIDVELHSKFVLPNGLVTCLKYNTKLHFD